MNLKQIISKDMALANLMELLKIEGLTGGEANVADWIAGHLVESGVPAESIWRDSANRYAGKGFETGNLIVKIPGRRDSRRLMFSAHMDTVPLCRGAEPRLRDGRVEPAGNTGLGGDDRAGCAAIVTLAECLFKSDISHPPLTLLFVFGEEGGLRGSRHVDLSELGNPTLGFNLDGESPEQISIGAIGATRWDCWIKGKSAHAGLNPEKGVSAAMIAGLALSEIRKAGYFGRIDLAEGQGRSNVGGMHGGEVANQVMDKLHVFGECRSHDPDFLMQITNFYQTAFERAAGRVRSSSGEMGSLKFLSETSYKSFLLDESEPAVRALVEAVGSLGLTPELIRLNAGLDANNFNEKGLPCVTLGTGTHNFHSLDEYVDLGEYLQTCKILLQLCLQNR